jgi:hypothetical protein
LFRLLGTFRHYGRESFLEREPFPEGSHFWWGAISGGKPFLEVSISGGEQFSLAVFTVTLFRNCGVCRTVASVALQIPALLRGWMMPPYHPTNFALTVPTTRNSQFYFTIIFLLLVPHQSPHYASKCASDSVEDVKHRVGGNNGNSDSRGRYA